MNKVLLTIHNCNVWKEYAKHYHESAKDYEFTIVYDDRVENLENVSNVISEYGSKKWKVIDFTSLKTKYLSEFLVSSGTITDYPYATKLLGIWYMMSEGFDKLLHIEQDCLIVNDLAKVFSNNLNMYISNMTKIHESDYTELRPQIRLLCDEIIKAFNGEITEEYYDDYISNLPIGAPIYLVYNKLPYNVVEYGNALKKLNLSEAISKLKRVSKPHIFNSDERILANLLIGNNSKIFTGAMFGRLTNKSYNDIKNKSIVHLVGPSRLTVLKSIYEETNNGKI